MRGPPIDDNRHPAEEENRMRDVDYSEYVWMGEEMEEFDKECFQEFCEEEFIESCFDDLFEEEQKFAAEMEMYLQNLSLDEARILFDQMDSFHLKSAVYCDESDDSEKSRLNPNAPEFVPRVPSEELKPDVDDEHKKKKQL